MCKCPSEQPDDSPPFDVVTNVSEPPELTEDDIRQIMAEARRIQAVMTKRIRAMERLTPEDLVVRAQ